MIHQMLPFLPRFAARSAVLIPVLLVLVLLAGIAAGPAAAQLPGLPAGGQADVAKEEKASGPPDYSALADRLENEAERKN